MRLILLLLLLCSPALARDDGRYANSPLRGWFDSLRNKDKAYCCSDADGRETDYEIRGLSYWVPINGEWTEVPDYAVITEPNKFGRAMVWLATAAQDQPPKIRCFIPSSGM